MSVRLFPLTLATGPAFCNREEERKALGTYILNGVHVWLQAHRRYGKSSLVEQTVLDLQTQNQAVIVGKVDLLLAASGEDVGRKLLQVVGGMAGQVPKGALDGIIKRLIGAFKRFKVDVSVSTSGPNVRFHESITPDVLKNALQALDDLAGTNNRRLMIYIDEFQSLAALETGDLYEAAIRSALQVSKNVSYVFSGSNRRLMEQAFTDKNRPLYRHCRSIALTRISAEKYHSHLSRLSKKQWGKPMSPRAIDDILDVTERHAFYVNNLCNHLWIESSLPGPKTVARAWQAVLAEIRQVNEPYIMGLSRNQQKVLIALATAPTHEPFAQAFVTRAGISAGSVRKTLQQLLLEDLITLNAEDNYFVIDPALSEILRRSKQDQ